MSRISFVLCPVLMLYGAMDVQAPGRENAAAAGALVREFGTSPNKAEGRSGRHTH